MPKGPRRTKRAGGDPRRLLLTAVAVAAAGLFLATWVKEPPASSRTRRTKTQRVRDRQRRGPTEVTRSERRAGHRSAPEPQQKPARHQNDRARLASAAPAGEERSAAHSSQAH